MIVPSVLFHFVRVTSVMSGEWAGSHLYNVDPASSIFCIELLRRFTWLQKCLWRIKKPHSLDGGNMIRTSKNLLEVQISGIQIRLKRNQTDFEESPQHIRSPLTRLARRSLGQNHHDESPHMPPSLPQSAKGAIGPKKKVTLCNPRDICLAWFFTNQLPQIRHFPHTGWN